MHIASFGAQAAVIRSKKAKALIGKEIMRKVWLFTLAILLLAVNVRSSEATPAWRCFKRHCYWTEGYTGPIPPFAAAWGPPRQPGCYYVRGLISKRWVEYCPPSTPMQ